MEKYNLQQQISQDANASFNKNAIIYASVNQYDYEKLLFVNSEN
jgi:hypothetical protein